MAKPCFQLHAEIKALGEEAFKTGVNWVALANGIKIKPSDNAESGFRELVKQTGMSPETARDHILRGFGMEAKIQNAADFERAADKASGTIGELTTPTAIMGALRKISDLSTKGMSQAFGGFQNLNISQEAKNMLVKYGGHQWLHELKPGVFVGKEQGEIWRNEIRKFHKELQGQKPAWEDFRNATTVIMSSFMENGEKKLDLPHLESQLQQIIEARKTKGADYATTPEAAIKSAIELSKNPEYMKWAVGESMKLEKVGEFLMDTGVIKQRKPSFFHNSIRMEMDSGDALESALFGRKLSMADFSKAKVFRGPVDAFLAGYMPTSWGADDIMAMYHDKVARRTSLNAAKGDIERNMGSWKIFTQDKENGENAFMNKTGSEAPKSLDGASYRDLGDYRHQLKGVYAHPEIADQWAAKVFKNVEPKGIISTYRSVNESLKKVAFTFDFYHALTLGTKVVELGGAFGMFINPFSLVRTGLDGVAEKNVHVVKAIEQGLTLTREQWESELMKNFKMNKQTGEVSENLWSRILSLGGLSNVVTKKIFHAWQPGWKAGLAMTLAETEPFRKWVAEGGEDYAYHNLAGIINNHLGGQNLVALGRSRMAQAFFQATFLAPDFQESKWRKNFGVFHQDPNVRKVYQTSLGVEAALTMVGVIALQAIADELLGQPSRFENGWFNDSVGRWLDVRVGKGPTGRNIYITPFGSNREDFRPVLAVVAKYHDAFSASEKGLTGGKNEFKGANIAQRILDPLAGDIKHEVTNKLAPPMRYFDQAGEKPFGYSKNKSLFGQTAEMAGLPILPISFQSALYAARGGFGSSSDDRLKYILASGLTTVTGTPLTEGKTPESGGKGSLNIFRSK